MKVGKTNIETEW